MEEKPGQNTMPKKRSTSPTRYGEDAQQKPQKTAAEAEETQPAGSQDTEEKQEVSHHQRRTGAANQGDDGTVKEKCDRDPTLQCAHLKPQPLQLILDDMPAMAFLLRDPRKVHSEGKDRLWCAFLSAVKDKSMDTLREHLKQYTLTVFNKCHEKVNTQQTISLTNNLSGEDDKLDEHDTAILRLHEVLLLFSCQVPQLLREAFIKTCREKKIPDKTADGKIKEYFVYAENKALWKMCKALSEQEVCQMYDNLRKKTANDFHYTTSGQDLMLLTVNPSDMENIKGLKEASFYCFVLALFKEGFFNRVHTHHLYDYLEIEEKPHVPVHSISAELERYPLGSKPPGICIIFNMEKGRKGAELDFQKLRDLFEKTFSYDVHSVINPTRADVTNTIGRLKEDKYMFYDSLVVVFMSHGNEHYLGVADGELHRRLDLIDPITKIDWLAKKPKLFFLQACANKDDEAKQKSGDSGAQGDALRIGYAPPTSPSLNTLYKNLIELEGLHPFADTLISHATKWYDAAARYEDTGSPYINILVDQLRRFGTKEPIEVVLRRVHYDTNMISMKIKDRDEPHRQAPYFESSLQKVFMFPTQPATV